MRIYKYQFNPQFGEFSIPMPRGARVLGVQLQADTPCIWAIVDHLCREIQHGFVSVGTGHELPMPKHSAFVGTVQMGPLVFSPVRPGRKVGLHGVAKRRCRPSSAVPRTWWDGSSERRGRNAAP